MLIPVPKDRTEKPPLGTPLRSDGHWSVQGLIGCWAYNEGAGNTIFSVTGLPNGSFTGTWDAYGAALASTQAIDFGNPVALQFNNSSSYSIFSVFKLGGTAGTSRNIFRKDIGGGSRALWLFRVNTSNFLDATFGKADLTLGSITGVTSLAVGNTYSATFTRTANSSLSLYLNGKLDKSGADNSTGSWTVSTGNVLSYYTGEYFNGTKIFDLIYSRALSPAESASLSANPWQVYQPDGPSVEVGGAAPSAFLAAWAVNSNQFIGAGYVS